MAQHEQNGSGTESESRDRESIWRPTDDSEEFGESATEDTSGPAASSPTPREQWFGGFEGAAPPPPPYARIPEDTPPPLPGTAFQGPAPGEEEGGLDDEDTLDEPEEMRSSTVRLMPGPRSRPWPPEPPNSQPWREERRPQRPARPGGEDPDPLGPRKLRKDPEVPEPEQLPPLEADRAERTERLGPPSSPVARSAPAPADEDEDTDFLGSPSPWNSGRRDTGSDDTLPVERTEPPSVSSPPSEANPPAAPSQPSSLTGPRHPGPAPSPRAATGAAPTRRPEQEHGETSDSLNAATLVRNRRHGPSTGWRKAVHTASLGLINPGESAKVLRQRELVARACTPVAQGHHRVAVLSLKGGVGKTTTTVALGATLASLRGDRVLAVDANPDRGTLSDKVRLETAATIRDLLNERHLVSRYADIRGFTSQAPSRLEILASDRDPAVSEAFSDADYREVARIVEHFYSICITDCGTGLLHAAMRGVLGLADQVVLVSSASVDGARSASATLDWLEAHGHGNLVQSAVVVLSMVRSNSKSSVDLNRLEEHFSGRCRSVVRVPWDGHLEEGAEVDLDQLAPATKDSYLQLAAGVGEAFAR
ncbi:MinD/ParA family ATP-binding protein [Nocardiopsis oceani]